MVIFTTEEKALESKVFEYRKTAVFTLSDKIKGKTLGDNEINYRQITFLPDEDIINGVVSGDIKPKKVIKDAKKALRYPNKDSAGIGLGLLQVITMITSSRKSKIGPPVIIFLMDPEEEPAKNKFFVKYISALMGEFGIIPVAGKKAKKALKIFKGKKRKIRNRVIAYVNNSKNHCLLSKAGAHLKEINMIYYEVELRFGAMNEAQKQSGKNPAPLDKEAREICTGALLKAFTGENLKKISSSKIAKSLAKRDRKMVKAYKSLRTILVDYYSTPVNIPAVKYGQKKKKGRIKGPKTNVKKFKKFFKKKSNENLLMLVYAHLVTSLFDVLPGSKEYTEHMKGFGKEFTEAAKAYAKASSTVEQK